MFKEKERTNRPVIWLCNKIPARICNYCPPTVIPGSDLPYVYRNERNRSQGHAVSCTCPASWMSPLVWRYTSETTIPCSLLCNFWNSGTGWQERVNTDEGLLRRVPDLFKYTDTDGSLTDCISFVVMKRDGIDIAYSSDQRFEQAGFHKQSGIAVPSGECPLPSISPILRRDRFGGQRWVSGCLSHPPATYNRWQKKWPAKAR